MIRFIAYMVVLLCYIQINSSLYKNDYFQKYDGLEAENGSVERKRSLFGL